MEVFYHRSPKYFCTYPRVTFAKEVHQTYNIPVDKQRKEKKKSVIVMFSFKGWFYNIHSLSGILKVEKVYNYCTTDVCYLALQGKGLSKV